MTLSQVKTVIIYCNMGQNALYTTACHSLDLCWSTMNDLTQTTAVILLSTSRITCWLPAWYRSAPKTLKTRLQTSQNKLVRLLHNLPPRPHLDPGHFQRLGWLRVDDRVQHLAMGLVYKIHYTTKVPMYCT